MTWGLTSTGFNMPTLDELRDEYVLSYRAAYGDAVNTEADSVFGQQIGIAVEREYRAWLAQRDVWQSGSPGGASGVSLTILASGTGTLRKDADIDPDGHSTVVATVNLNAGVTLPAGSVARTADTEAQFETLADVTNSGGSPANVAVDMQALDPGPVRANAATLTVIVTPVSGWNSVTNALDAELGIADEEDTALRTRREAELRAQGSSNIDAIAADIARVDGVIDVAPFENDTDSTVGSLTPHSFRMVVWDGVSPAADDDEIAQAIWDSKPAGNASIGAETGTAIDARGGEHDVDFDRATSVPIYLEFDIDVDAQTWPVDGPAQVKTAVKAYADANWTIDADVVLSALYGSVFSISGVRRIAAVRAGLAPSPAGVIDLTIDTDEIALADTSRIEVNV